jgi:serine protease AprX
MDRRLIDVGLAFGLATLLLTGLALSVWSAPMTVLAAPPANVAPHVWAATAEGGDAEFLVILAEQADLGAPSAACPPSGATREARLRCVYDTLREVALRSQASLRAELDAAGVEYRPFYVANMVAVRGDRALVTRLAARPEVARVAANPRIRQPLPEPQRLPNAARLHPSQGIEWNVARVNADDVWALGYTGQSIVVAGQDTGYDWDHPALIDQYRGYDGVAATHDYNWHDAIHTNSHGYNPCGADSSEPCDDHGHGTHTMGTIVGDDGEGNQIGVAPGAHWIGCRNMDNRYGTPATYAECFEFFLAPYPVGGDPFADGAPSLAPHVINNSWTCPPSEGCEPDTLRTVVENVRAAGIVVVASAGNYGDGCSSVNSPIATYDAAFSVGASNSSDDIASFSSRGPVTVDGSGRLKPDVTAPGVGVRSSLLGGGYGFSSGTSMAGPHVAGTVALLWSAAPRLVGDVDGTERAIAGAARPRTTTQGCGGDGPGDVPNNVYGWGVVDALAAVQASPLSKEAIFSMGIPVRSLVYTLAFTNTFDSTLTQVVLTDAIPVSTTFAWASGDYTQAGGVVTWAAVNLASQERLTATLAVTVEHLPPGTRVVNDAYGLRASEMPAPAMGSPVDAVVPWRGALPLVLRGGALGGDDGG